MIQMKQRNVSGRFKISLKHVSAINNYITACGGENELSSLKFKKRIRFDVKE